MKKKIIQIKQFYEIATLKEINLGVESGNDDQEADSEEEKKSRRNNEKKDEKKLNKYYHFKFAYSPMIIRYVPFYQVIELKQYEELFLRQMKRQSNKLFSNQSINQTKFLYEPLIWLDDLSISNKHYKLISFSNTTSSLSINSRNITFEFQYLPTSIYRYYLKVIFQFLIQILISISSIISSSSSSSSSELINKVSSLTFKDLLTSSKYFKFF